MMKSPGELIGWWAIHPSSVHTFDQLYLCSLQADLSHFLTVACLWYGISEISISWKFNENLGYYGNHKVP